MGKFDKAEQFQIYEQFWYPHLEKVLMLEENQKSKFSKEELNLLAKTNEKIRYKDLQYFLLKLHLNFVAKLIRCPDDSIQKQLLFSDKNNREIWGHLVEVTKMSKENLMVKMQDEEGFKKFLENDLIEGF